VAVPFMKNEEVFKINGPVLESSAYKYVFLHINVYFPIM
jgi:hypothetical protein